MVVDIVPFTVMAGLDWASTPDGEKLVYVNTNVETGGNLDLYAVSPDGTGVVQLTDTPLGSEMWPSFAPTGDRL